MKNDMYRRQLPSDLEAEKALLGAVLLDNDELSDAIEKVGADDFYDKKHIIIFKAILELNDEHRAVDVITLSDRLRNMGKLDVVGGSGYLNLLSDSVPISINCGEYADIIAEKSLLRKLIKASTDIIEESYSGENSQEVLEMAEKAIFNIAQKRTGEGFSSIDEVMQETFKQIKENSRKKGGMTGVDTGIPGLNNRTFGFQKSDLILLAARPSMGKTALSLNFCVNAAKKGAKVAIISLEMSKFQLAQRVIASECAIDLNSVKSGDLSEKEWPKLFEGIKNIRKLPIYINDKSEVTIPQLKAQLRKLKLDAGLDMIMIDYLQLIEGSGGGENRQNEISKISRSLKGLAREMECPVLALSQLSRGPESRQDKRPMLSDLRDSGAIEQDADLVMFLYRDFYYNEKPGTENVAELIIAKHRNGETGHMKLFWRGNIQKFDELKEDFPLSDSIPN